MRKIIFTLLFPLIVRLSFAQDACAPVGWGTQNGGVTGGGSAAPQTVTTYSALKTALTTASVKVVYVQGTITFPSNGRITIQDQSGKTIIGLPGSKLVSVDLTASGSGIFYIKRCTNFIIRNMTFEGPGAYDVDGNDNLTLDDCQNFWVDHCDFQDGTDGNFDMKNMTDYISVTWCKFSYNKAPIPGGPGGANDHRFTDLIGSSDSATQDAGKLRITFQYCWWAQGCVARMPRVRFGKVHIVNNLYSSTVANQCVQAGYKADLLVESNVFKNVNKPIDLMNNDFTAITQRNNIFTNVTGNTAGSGTSFTPPYTLSIASASNVEALVTNTTCGAGATMDGPTLCGCGTINVNPTVSISTTTSSLCLGSSFTINATATDTDGSISKVEFYNGSTLIGTDNSSPYSFTYTPTTSGSLTIKAIAYDNLNATGISSNTTVTVNALPTATITAASSTTFCQGGSVVLNANTGTGLTYQWRNGTTNIASATAASYTATTAGSYNVIVKSANNCSVTSSNTTVTVNALPTATITAASSTTFCQGGSVVLNANTGTGLTYQWRNGTTNIASATTASYTANTAGSYNVIVKNANNCSATSSNTTVTVNALPTATITAAGATTVCQGGSVVLNANTGTGLTYQWRNGTTNIASATAASYTATSSGSYNVIVKNSSNCSTTSANISVTVKAALQVSINPSGTVKLIPNSSVTLTANTSNTGITYQWYKNGASVTGTSATYSSTQAGDYTVKISDGICEATSSITKIVNAIAPVVSITSPANNTIYTTPAGFNLTIAASDNDGTISKIDIYQNNVKIATVSSSPYQYAVSNLPVGTYVYYAIATDSDGLSTTSANTTIKVNANNPPVVTFNATVTTTQDINIDLTATDPENKAVRVEIYDGSTLITTLNNAPYLYTILSPSVGSHTITIKAIDADGIVTTQSKTVDVAAKVTTSVANQHLIFARVYPNPFVDQIKIEAIGTYNYEVRNTMGQLVTSGTMTDELILGNQLNAGNYLLYLKNDNQVNCLSIIKQ